MTARDLTPNVTDCALAFEGGGYREAFSAGVATVLMDAGTMCEAVVQCCKGTTLHSAMLLG